MTEVLVVRKFETFSRVLIENGLAVINCPTIETAEKENLPALAAKISARHYDGIFLTSPKATEIACREIFCKNFNYRGKIYILGKSSFEQLRDKNLDLRFDARWNTAREMLEAISPEELSGKFFLFIRGEKSLRAIPEFLEKTAAAIDEAVVYDTRRVTIEDELKNRIVAKTAAGEIRAACFFSPSGAESFLEQFGAGVLHQTKIASIGSTTADFLETRDLRVDFTPTRSTAEDFAIELVEYLNGN